MRGSEILIKGMILEIFGGAWTMIVIFTIILSSVRIAYLISKKEKFVFYKELTYLLFIIYLLSLFYIVTFQDDNYGLSNYIPFKEMFRYSLNSKMFIKNFIGNILLFMPFGLFVTAYLDQNKVYPAVILTAISSVSIEIVQNIIGRVFDVDDIILNIIGGAIGAIVFILLDKLRDKLPNVLKKEWFLNLVMILLMLVGIIYLTNFTEYIGEMVN